MQKQTVISIFESFHKITRARISLYDSELNELFSFPKELLPFCSSIQKNRLGKAKCVECDKEAFETVKRTGKPYSYMCHCGLSETVTPIYHFGVLSGYIMMGQTSDKSYKSMQNIRELSRIYFSSNEEHSAAVLRIPEIPSALTEAYINILKVISEFITQQNFLSNKSKDRPLNIKNYINAHFTEDITIDSIAFEFECSRATVMNCFRNAYGTTISSFINQKRLELARELLCDSTKSIKEICLSCGFHDQNYFSRIFLREYSITPSEFRKQQNRQE